MNTNVDVYEGEDSETLTQMDQSGSLAVQLSRAEIDQQIATAHKFPRIMKNVAQTIHQLATFSPQAADEMAFALPRGGKPIIGPSIRFAEIVAQQYGNCRVGARVVHVDRVEGFVESEGVFHDLEKNTQTVKRTKRSILDRKGQLFKEDMIIVTGNAACSISQRNAILAGVPKALWAPGYEAALTASRGEAKTLVERRQIAINHFLGKGVTEAQIFASLEIESIDDMGENELQLLRAIVNTVKDTPSMLEKFFPPMKSAKAAANAARGTASRLEELAQEHEAETQKAQTSQKQAQDAKSEPEQPNTTEGEKDAQGGADGGDEGKQQEEQGQPEQKPDTSDKRSPYNRGKTAFRRNSPRTAVPPDVKDDEELLAQWHKGFDDAKAEAETDEQ